MMDSTRVIPGGFHFVKTGSRDGTRFNLTWKHRCSVAPVDYYYIDLGLASCYPTGPDGAAVFGRYGQLKDVPEFSDTVPFNPFKVDVYQMGRTILEIAEVSQLFTDSSSH